MIRNVKDLTKLLEQELLRYMVHETNNSIYVIPDKAIEQLANRVWRGLYSEDSTVND